MSRLLVVASERISEWLGKGEVIDRYYNPGNVFSRVDVLLTNDDMPDAAAVQRLVGTADLAIHNLESGRKLFARTLGWRPALLRSWAGGAVDIARAVRPDVVRCYGAGLNAFAARCIKEALGIPYLVSLHINPDEDVRRRARTWPDKLRGRAGKGVERTGLLGADLVLPVYEPIVPYLRRVGVERIRVAYNMVNSNVTPKDDYALHRPVRVVSVGRQLTDKDPSNLIRAIAALPDGSLTLVGDGPLHGELRALADRLGVGDRVTFRAAVPNDELCALLPTYDVFAVHSEYWELSKAVLEAMLSGLPVVINRRHGDPVPELTDDICLLVDGSADGYRGAVEGLVADDDRRAALGRRAAEVATERWSPAATEGAFAEIYRSFLGAGVR